MNEFLHHAAQAWLLVLSAFGVWCLARTDRWHRWGYVLGLLCEPAWFYAAWTTGQWGTMILAVWWGYQYAAGIARRFSIFKPTHHGRCEKTRDRRRYTRPGVTYGEHECNAAGCRYQGPGRQFH